MPRRQVTTTLGGVQYVLNQLGGDTVAELGEELLEATALAMRGVPGIAAATRKVRKALVEVSLVIVEDAGKTRPVKMRDIFDDHFMTRPEDMGRWFAWAVKESGLPAFLAGGLKTLVPSLLDRLPSVFRQEPDGSRTVLSSATA